MRETIQDKVNSWFVEKRNVETGEYPDFPEPEDGGSKVGGVWRRGGRVGEGKGRGEGEMEEGEMKQVEDG
jgi:hypothetical protein